VRRERKDVHRKRDEVIEETRHCVLRSGRKLEDPATMQEGVKLDILNDGQRQRGKAVKDQEEKANDGDGIG
jgi:hypothetical protein